MKKILIIISALSLWSCQSNVVGDLVDMPEGKGQLKSSFITDNISDDAIKITISKDGEIVEAWNSINEIPEVMSLVAGEYAVTAKTADEMPLVSDKPYYNASGSFTIVEGDVSYFALECNMLNMKVDIALSEALTTEFPEWQADLFLLDDIEHSVMTFNAEANETVYLAPMAFGVTLKDVATSESRTVIFEEFGAAMYHNVKFE